MRVKVQITAMQGTTDAIFTVEQMQKKFGKGEEDKYLFFWQISCFASECSAPLF